MMDFKNKLYKYKFQRLAIELLYHSLKKKHISPAYLFQGPKGVGQKEIALEFLETISM